MWRTWQQHLVQNMSGFEVESGNKRFAEQRAGLIGHTVAGVQPQWEGASASPLGWAERKDVNAPNNWRAINIPHWDPDAWHADENHMSKPSGESVAQLRVGWAPPSADSLWLQAPTSGLEEELKSLKLSRSKWDWSGSLLLGATPTYEDCEGEEISSCLQCTMIAK